MQISYINLKPNRFSYQFLVSLFYDDFQKNEGALFLLKEHDLHIRLVEVSPQKISGPWETFSLLFKAEGEFSLEQGTFFLESDVLGELDPGEYDLIARFLDPEMFEGDPDLPIPSHPSPLVFRMFEAIGEPIPTRLLPRAFSHADLRANAGWKARLEAAERLARAGAISDNVLLGLYNARVPAASGGAWDRARAVSRLEAALAGDDADAMLRALTDFWREAANAGVAAPLARAYAPQLLQSTVPDSRSDAVLFKILLLSDHYEDAALIDALAATDPFLAAVARGDPSGVAVNRAKYPLIQQAFAAEPNAALVAMAGDGRTGEAILRSIATLQQGIDGDRTAFKEGFATLRALGLEDMARRTALQYLLLP